MLPHCVPRVRESAKDRLTIVWEPLMVARCSSGSPFVYFMGLRNLCSCLPPPPCDSDACIVEEHVVVTEDLLYAARCSLAL